MSKELKTIKDIIEDAKFIETVGKSIEAIKKDRRNRPEPKPGYRYRRDAIDTLQDQGNFNRDFFILNIPDVWVKRSSLNSKTRQVIEYVCNMALFHTKEYYSRPENG